MNYRNTNRRNVEKTIETLDAINIQLTFDIGDECKKELEEQRGVIIKILEEYAQDLMSETEFDSLVEILEECQ